ncbi:Outer membrane protein beta-barrel domain-containing protein [Roseivivax halotolerans]|uniref:Outer membrane protein beta-barrel domain-containing protein n=1 Tax=Roseivivax halotolerans TaxID=93684 RepID=A0A1I6AC67_9RHOB|nr:outer membrane beta-barrel protein [Roseivivax halotolerans]SFQ66279.1 Outer membrane protein beta-barrel domain-containing protein [Roseivivax halotolerans]
MFAKTMTAAVALSAATATAAFAGDPMAGKAEPAPMAPAPTPAPAPAPVYDFTGPSVGVQLGYNDLDLDSDLGDEEEEGGSIGVRGNYDFRLGNSIIAGVGLQYDEANIELENSGELDNIMRLGGRLGVDSGRNFFYGTGGYARATGADDDLGDSDGYFAGVGYEVFLQENVTVGTEVVYQEFNEFDNDAELDATSANVSLNYRF